MKLYLLRPRENGNKSLPPWETWYDKVYGFVVRAESEESAREIANKNGGDEIAYGDVWIDPNLSICIELTTDGPEEMIIRDFASG